LKHAFTDKIFYACLLAGQLWYGYCLASRGVQCTPRIIIIIIIIIRQIGGTALAPDSCRGNKSHHLIVTFRSANRFPSRRHFRPWSLVQEKMGNGNTAKQFASGKHDTWRNTFWDMDLFVSYKVAQVLRIIH
jgi:hypothetical protein